MPATSRSAPLCLGIAVLLAAATTADAKPPAKKEGLLYVAFVAGDDPRTTGLVEVLEQEVFVAAQLTLSSGDSVYRDVTSRRRIELERGSVLNSLLEFQQYVSLGMRDEVNRIRGQLRLAVTDFLVIKVLATGTDTVRVDMELRSLEDWRLVQMKTVGACPMSAAEVSAQVRSVISDLVAGRVDRPARAMATSTPPSPVRLGTAITLDGCESRDPDWDTLEWKWRTVRAPEGADPLPEAGFVGTGFHFRPRQEGRYVFELGVARVLDGRPAQPSRFSLDVVREPWADAGPNRLVEALGQRIELDGSRSSPWLGPEGSTRFTWRQIKGTTAELEPLDESGRSQSFVAEQAGLFAFELSVANQVGTATDAVTILVAPPPVVDPGPDVDAYPHHKMTLDGRGSFDLIDPSPEFLWRLETSTATAHILGAHSAMPVFIATEEGTYRVRLQIRARRNLGDEERWVLASKVVTIEVVRPTMTLFLRTETTMRFRDDGSTFISDDRKSHAFLLAGIGLLYAPPWLPSWLAVRFTQGLMRMRLDPPGRDEATTTNVSREPEFSGGGSVGFEASLSGPTIRVGGYLGTLFKVGSAMQTGLSVGGMMQWRVYLGLVLKFEAGYGGFMTFSEALEEDGWIHAVQLSASLGVEI